MNDYYIQLDGKKQGPFSLQDLRKQQITAETPIWRGGAANPVPAEQVEELKSLLKNNLSSPDTDLPITGDRHDQNGIKGHPATLASRPFPKSMQIAILLLAIAVIGTAVFFWVRKDKGVPQKDEISTIHEREVQKAIKELSAEKQAKKAAEQRQKLLREKKVELQSLNAQLKQVRARKADALNELDEIRRPHLFRSRAKKNAQMDEQLEIIDRMDVKAASLTKRIASCQAALDTLSEGSKP
jgi:hypothetical protein